MSNNNPLHAVVRGAAFATGAALLTPINVLFLNREAISIVIAIGVIQVLLLLKGVVTLWSAHRASRK